MGPGQYLGAGPGDRERKLELRLLPRGVDLVRDQLGGEVLPCAISEGKIDADLFGGP